MSEYLRLPYIASYRLQTFRPVQSRPVSLFCLQYKIPSMPVKNFKSIFPLLHVHCKALPIFFHSLSNSRQEYAIVSVLCYVKVSSSSPKRSFPFEHFTMICRPCSRVSKCNSSFSQVRGHIIGEAFDNT